MEHSEKSWKAIDWFAIFFIVSLGLFIRFYHLDSRPLHHDESLHGMYSLYYLENPIRNFYKYDPLLHGPLLYHIIPWFFWLFGVTKFAVRLPAVLIGSMLMIVPLLLRNWLSKSTCLLLLAFISLSPTLVYWSRFIRHDSFILIGIMTMFLGFLTRPPFLKALLIGLGLGLQFSAKENTFIHLTFLIVFMLYEAVIDQLFNLQQRTLFQRLLSFTIEHPVSTLMGVLTLVATFLHYYTAGFVYWEGALDGLYRKSLVYWFEQHHSERITGPFSFSFLINLFFEAWWVPALFLHLFTFYKRQTWIIRVAFFLSIVFGALTHFSMNDPGVKQFVSTYLKLKIPLDYYFFFPLVFHAVVAPTTYLLEKRQAKATLAFFFLASLFTYSYVGEKVPWLAIYPLITGLFFYAFEYDRTFYWPIIPVIILMIGHMGYTTYWTNIKFSGSPKNILTQVHTTSDLEETLIEIRSQMESQPRGKRPYLLVKDEGTWPTTWYLHGRSEYHHLLGQQPLKTYTYILGKPNDSELRAKLANDYNREIIPYRSWWLPDYKKISLSTVWNYFLKKDPWNDIGTQTLGLWVKKREVTPSIGQ